MSLKKLWVPPTITRLSLSDTEATSYGGCGSSKGSSTPGGCGSDSKITAHIVTPPKERCTNHILDETSGMIIF